MVKPVSLRRRNAGAQHATASANMLVRTTVRILGLSKGAYAKALDRVIVLPDVLAVVNRTCNLAPRLHHGEGLCFRPTYLTDAGRGEYTLSRKSVRTVRRSLISDARKLWRSCWRRCRKVQRSLFRKVPSSWNTPGIHSRSTIQSRSQQHLRKPRCGMRGDTPFG